MANNNYYYFNKDNYIFNNSKTLQNLIDTIKEAENDNDLNVNTTTKEMSKLMKAWIA